MDLISMYNSENRTILVLLKGNKNPQQRSDPLSLEVLQNFGKKLHHSETLQSDASLVLEVLKMGRSKTCHFLELI